LKIDIAAITHQDALNRRISFQKSEIDEVAEIKEMEHSPRGKVTQYVWLGQCKIPAPESPWLGQPLPDMPGKKEEMFDLRTTGQQFLLG